MSRPCPARCVDGRACGGRVLRAGHLVCGAHASAFARSWLGGSSVANLARDHRVAEDVVERTVRRVVCARLERTEEGLRETNRIADELLREARRGRGASW
jgi:hypothetical protein